MNAFIETIISDQPQKRNRSFFELSRKTSAKELLVALRELDDFRKTTVNLYHKVRALLFLYAGYRFFLMENNETPAVVKIPFTVYEVLLSRRFELAITTFLN